MDRIPTDLTDSGKGLSEDDQQNYDQQK